VGGLVAAVRELVSHPGRDGHHLAGLGDHGLATHLELHRAAQHLEALHLGRVHVLTRHVAVRGELEIELEQLAAGVSRGPPEGDALAGDRVLEDLSCVCHFRSFAST
jgi:hypothetical protein